MIVPFPAVTIQSNDAFLNDFANQVNRAFEALDTAFGSEDAGAVLADRSIAGVKLILGTVTELELAVGAVASGNIQGLAVTNGHIANATITAGKMNVSSLSSIVANAGTITSGNLISSTYNATQGISMDISTGAFHVGGSTNKYFSVDQFGQVVAKVANVSGTIQALAGDIGGMTISSGLTAPSAGYQNTSAYWGTGSNILVANGTSITHRLYAGHATPASAPFQVSNTGILTASTAVLSNPTVSTGVFTSPSIIGATINNSAVTGVFSVNSGVTFNVASAMNSTAAITCTTLTGSGRVKGADVETGAPSGGGGAAAWKLGGRRVAASALDTAGYLEVDIGGIALKIALIT